MTRYERLTPRLLLLYSGFGPYHRARWRSLRSAAPGRGWCASAVEILGAQDRYRWDPGSDEDGIVRLGFPSDGRDQVRGSDAARFLSAIARLRPDVLAVNGWALRDSILSTIGGGTSEIQRSIIARSLLDLGF